jgi:flagellar biosynthetic protein FliR
MDAAQTNATDWNQLAPALLLALVRVSTMLALAPFFGSRSLPNRPKAVFALAVCILLVPTVAAAATPSLGAHVVTMSFTGLLGEVAVGALYGLTLGLLNEMLLLAGQIVGLQFSFSLVNLLDPASEIQTPLMGDLFQLMGTLVLIAGGFDRILLASMVRSIRVVPLGSFPLSGISISAKILIPLLSGSFFAALELAAPVLAATLLVEIAVALIGKLSPQLPVISLTVPMKTLTGFVLLIGALALWPRFIEARFSNLLDVAERLISQGVTGGRG